VHFDFIHTQKYQFYLCFRLVAFDECSKRVDELEHRTYTGLAKVGSKRLCSVNPMELERMTTCTKSERNNFSANREYDIIREYSLLCTWCVKGDGHKRKAEFLTLSDRNKLFKKMSNLEYS